jgi:hypothetical protein
VSSITSLRQLAINAGAMDELDTADFEVFAHGTTAGFGTELVESQGGCLSPVGGNWAGSFHTVPNLDVASVFARRGCSKRPGEKPMVIGIALPRSVATNLKSQGLLSSPPIPNPPAGVSDVTPQYVFHRGALETVVHSGFFFVIA